MTTNSDAGTHRALTRGVVPRAGVFVPLVYALSALFSLAFMGVTAAFGLDPAGGGGIPQEVTDILTFSTGALLLGVVPGLFLAKSTTRSWVGAIVYGSLSILTLIFFWSGVPGIFGAVAAWLGGLTRGRPALRGAGRAFGTVGLCIALLNCVTTIAGLAIFATGHS